MDTTTKLIPDPTKDAPVFYDLPAVSLEEGMSTADGQNILDVGEIDLGVLVHVYTPADDEAEDERRQAAPEARVYKVTDTVDMADFVNTSTPGRVHPDAQIRLTLSVTELRPGDFLLGAGSVAGVEPNEHIDPEAGRQYTVRLENGEPWSGCFEHRPVKVLRPSGLIEEVMVSELEEGDLYRNGGDEAFFDVEDITEGDLPTEFDDPDELTVTSSNGNEAVYDSSAVVERWRPYQREEQSRG